MKSIFEGNDVTEEYKTTGKVEVPLRVINSCVMTINLTNGVSKDVEWILACKDFTFLKTKQNLLETLFLAGNV